MRTTTRMLTIIICMLFGLYMIMLGENMILAFGPVDGDDDSQENRPFTLHPAHGAIPVLPSSQPSQKVSPDDTNSLIRLTTSEQLWHNHPQDIGPKDVPADMYPIYSCPNLSNAYLLPIWYGSCLDACQITTPKHTVNVKLWTINSSVTDVDGYQIDVYYDTKFSHVGPFGGCSVSLSESVTKEPKQEDIMIWKSRLVSKPVNDVESWIMYDEPSCNYFSDEYSSGFRLVITRTKLKLMIDSVGNLYIADLRPGSYDTYKTGYAIHGSTAWIWDTDDSMNHGMCYFKQTDDTYCDYDNNTKYMFCKMSGVSFDTTVQQRITSSCAGDLNISTDGVIYQIGDSGDTASTQQRLSDILHQNVELGMQSLVSLINDVFINIESSYCTGVCDIMEVIVSNYPTATTVLETPIGPWLPITSDGHTIMTPCMADVNWIIQTPIVYCFSKEMIKVINKDTRKEAWWRIVNSYIILNETCSDTNSTALEILRDRMSKRRDIVYSFWRGDLIVSYPYNKSRWITYKDEKIQRSSKWFDKLVDLKYKHPITLDNITSQLVNHTADLYEWHMGDKNGTAGQTTFSDLLGRVEKAGTNVIKGCVKMTGNLLIWITSHIEMIGDMLIIIVCLIGGYYVLIIPYGFLRRGRGPGTVTEVQQSNSQFRSPLIPRTYL
ncbi:glycoprotein [Wheat yellow striate virus]|uniref:Glycoprotein n=1 Tax=Wheat yellow striate virus TaxID=2152660 RepID=A0A2R4K2I7_9RHAB|nr:glycoprotein [Wheat yellow striate virus]AVV48079.1 glycoprotein [Wheat yellow striate virus]